MRIERTGATEGTIEQFADRRGLTMEIYLNKYTGERTARFQGTNVLHSGKKVSIIGRGYTDKEAINNYAEQISNRTLIFFDGDELEVWRLI